ncbi:NAD(P)H-dependent oxidoreductase, partial [bacterium]|nr:NAD(P)H-dependent oxidoreductase [bacterium]MBQ3368612.1 NAD(P)H-dependent oxidoreductase [bacterium]
MTKKVLFIIGSLRKKSFNRQLAAKCREILEKSGNIEITELGF